MTKAQRNRERYRLEGALGYCLRIAEKIESKVSIDELNKGVQEDFERVSAALSRHCRDDIKNAGFEVGLFEDDTKLTSNEQSKN
jgi:hypothetical protein